jgi:hypothetical protein
MNKIRDVALVFIVVLMFFYDWPVLLFIGILAVIMLMIDLTNVFTNY